jgi:hypothetical protein
MWLVANAHGDVEESFGGGSSSTFRLHYLEQGVITHGKRRQRKTAEPGDPRPSRDPEF